MKIRIYNEGTLLEGQIAWDGADARNDSDTSAYEMSEEEALDYADRIDAGKCGFRSHYMNTLAETLREHADYEQPGFESD